MRFEVLGPLRVVDDDGSDITPRGPQQRRLLTALIAASPRTVAVDALEELLWPGGAPSANALQAAVSKLRRQIAPAAVDGGPRGYALVVAEPHEIDARRFEQLAEAGGFDEALALVRGRPLDEIADDELGAAECARLEGVIRLVRHRRLEALVERRPDAAVPELERLVAEEPLDEAWWAALMLAQYRAGRQADSLRTFQRARSVLAEQLGIEPGHQLRQLERRVLDQDPTLSPIAASPTLNDPPPEAVVAPRRRLPARLATFVGRETELHELAAAIERRRLVTLTGAGGAGKTTTVLELGRRLARDAVFVELATLTDRTEVARAIGRAIGLPEVDQPPPGGHREDELDRVVDALLDADTLVLLDNCEHLVDVVAEVVHRVLVACPQVTVVATSRSSLGVPGEHVVPLPPLPADDAIDLLVQRAQEHGAGIALDVGRRDRLAALCERLDGLPLAIELAAARLRTMSVDDVAARLEDRFALLSVGARTVEPRQQTLRAVVDWSHDLLQPVERVVFRRLSVFVGGARADAVERVAGGPDPTGLVVGGEDVLDVLDRLVDQSLVVADHTPDGVRFTMLQTLQDYAREQLASTGETEAVVLRHARCFADDLRPAMRGLVGHDQVRWFTRIRAERRNIDAAIETAIALDDGGLALELTVPIGWYCFMAGELEPGLRAFEGALSCSGSSDPGLRAAALGLYGWLLANGPAVEQAVATTSEALDLLDEVDDPWFQGLVANTHVMSLFFSGRLASVEAFLPTLVDIAERSGDRWIAAMTSVVRGEITQFRGQTRAAERLFAEAADEFEAVGDRFAYALTITEASELAEMVGDYDRAVELLEQGIAIADEVGFSGHPLAMRARLGNVEILRGDLDAARRHHRSLLDDPTASGVPWLQAMARLGLANVARRTGDDAEAERQLRHAWDNRRSRSVPFMCTIVQVAFGYLADQRGDLHQAVAHQSLALRTARQLDTPRHLAYALEGCAGALALADGAGARRTAARLLGHADRLRRDSGGPMPAAERFDVDRAEARLRAALGDDEFVTCSSAGAALSTEAIVAEVEDVFASVSDPS